MKKIISTILATAMTFGTFASISMAEEKECQIKNIIYMIPDGGGNVPMQLANAVKAAGGFNEGVFPYATKTSEGGLTLFNYLVGGEKTNNVSNDLTDSAASGTALSSGYKTKNGYIGINKDKMPQATILESCQLLGKKTGMVSTYDWANATPAAFSSHDRSRSDASVLSEQITNQGIDVVLGVGYGVAGWGSINEAVERGYDIINTKEDLSNIKKGDRVWGNMVYDEFPYDIKNTEKTPTLAEMTEAAITALADADEDGFFLMVEGSRVDGCGHVNDAVAMVGDILAFDAAFEKAVEFAKGRTDTMVVACPDHDTGGMILPEDISMAVEDVQKGIEPEAVTWESKNHTTRNGQVFMYIPEGVKKLEAFDNASKNPYEENVIENEEICRYIESIIGVNASEDTSKLFVNVTDRGTYRKNTNVFTFNDYPVSVKANCSYAFMDQKAVDLDGQVAVMIEGKFFVPQILLDIIEGTREKVYVDRALFNCRLEYNMPVGDEPNMCLTMDGFCVNKELSGTVEFEKPECLKELGKIEFSGVSSEESKKIEFNCPDFDPNGCNCEYTVTLADGGKYSFSQNVKGILSASYTEAPITVDGVLDEAEWAKAQKTMVDSQEQIVGIENWKGFRDLSASFMIMYDEDFFYFGAVVSDENYVQESADDLMHMSDDDSIQLAWYNDIDGLYKEKIASADHEGMSFAYINGEPKAYRTNRQVDYTGRGEVKQSDDFQMACSQTDHDITYEFKVSWEYLLGYNKDWSEGDVLPFSFQVNDDDGEGKRGWMEYGSGISPVKDVNKFVKLYFTGKEREKIAEENSINVYLNGERLSLNAPAYIDEDRVMVSVEDMLNSFGVEYTESLGKYTITDNPFLVSARCFKLNDQEIEFAPRNCYKDNTLYAPVRPICENLGATVEWDGEARAINIVK